MTPHNPTPTPPRPCAPIVSHVERIPLRLRRDYSDAPRAALVVSCDGDANTGHGRVLARGELWRRLAEQGAAHFSGAVRMPS